MSNIEAAIRSILAGIGEDAEREGLQDTPSRVAKAWAEWTSGYAMDAGDILKTFEDGSSEDDDLIIVKNIPFYTHCEHHMAPFFGVATIGYVPNGSIVGLSKLSRLVDMYARRLQVQERLTSQIADALDLHLAPKGVGVYLKARHMCMESRGICKSGSETETRSFKGTLRQGNLRQEFLDACR
jgi:GTP cyclohydrolase I